jgi:hypothetical protein
MLRSMGQSAGVDAHPVTVFRDRPLRLIASAGAALFAGVCVLIAFTGGIDRPSDVAGPLIVGAVGAWLGLRAGRSRLEVDDMKVRVVRPFTIVEIPSEDIEAIGRSQAGLVFVRRDGSSVVSTCYGSSPINLAAGKSTEASAVAEAIWRRLGR